MLHQSSSWFDIYSIASDMHLTKEAGLISGLLRTADSPQTDICATFRLIRHRDITGGKCQGVGPDVFEKLLLQLLSFKSSLIMSQVTAVPWPATLEPASFEYHEGQLKLRLLQRRLRDHALSLP
ncbi:hypothetical protein SRHO_G00055700 [Serrasalmus rhombeus]